MKEKLDIEVVTVGLGLAVVATVSGIIGYLSAMDKIIG